MNPVMAIDPGLRHVGAAVFEAGVLTRVALVRNPEQVKRGPEAWHSMASTVQAFAPVCSVLVTEFPQVYDPRHQKGDQGDLIEVAGVAGAIVGAMFERAGTVVGYLPRTWKGQVPKDIHNKRILGKLSPAELEHLKGIPLSLVHNVVDAVGIGLFFLTKTGDRK